MKLYQIFLFLLLLFFMMGCNVAGNQPESEQNNQNTQDAEEEGIVAEITGIDDDILDLNYEYEFIQVMEIDTSPALTHVKVMKPDLKPGENYAGTYPLHVDLNSVGDLVFYTINTGYVASGPCWAKILLYCGSTVLEYHRYIPALEPGYQVDTMPITPPVGWYNPDGNFYIKVDYRDVIDEINETNNDETGAIVG
ncbi:MAG: hypothetical protein MJB14_08135 [Spirochaetes bacterium]|nr:hypothetical protein [Spirochaetota bacterium]